MKKIVFLFLLFSFSMYSQYETYKYHVYIEDYENSPEFVKLNDRLVYSGNNLELSSFLKPYTIVNFFQKFPTSTWQINLRVFQFETLNADLIDKLITRFPYLFSGYTDITEEEFNLTTYYTNDYGNSNPNGNNGLNINRNDLDYINVAKAWDITKNIENNVTIGISDARINMTDADFVDKVSFINPYYTQFFPYQDNINYSHGTQVAGIAAAQGDNNHGSTGVCYNCDIIGTAFGSYYNLLLLAQAGVKVINMSWAGGTFSKDYQNIIDEIVQDYKVVLVAGAGNTSSYQTEIDGFCGSSHWDSQQNRFISNVIGTQYMYPASYNGVISVSGIGHLYAPDETINIESVSPFGFPIALFTRDSFSPNVNVLNPNNPIGLIYNGWTQYCPFGNGYGVVSTNGAVLLNTSNPLVDVLAPAYNNFSFPKLAEENVVFYYDGGGTSSATPYVSGTAALMINVNECLLPMEVDNIIKLTSKNVEVLGINQNFTGNIGAGSLNAGDAVEFVNEMKKINGNSIIKNQRFNRFNFLLEHINNQLTFKNVSFIGNCISEFTARNEIRLLEGTHLKPSGIAYTLLKINNEMQIDCESIVYSNKEKNIKKSIIEKKFESLVLYPNPGNGIVNIKNITKELFQSNSLKIIVYDINGRVLQNKDINETEFQNLRLDLSNLSSGLYFIKLFSPSFSNEFKYLKE